MSDSTPTDGPTGEPTPEQTPASGSTPSTPSTPSASEAVATLKSANPLDLGMIGAGVLAFLGSLLPYYTVSVEFLGTSESSSVNAWHGFFGWFGAFAALAAAAVLVAKLLGIALPVPTRTTVLGLFGLAAVCTLLALFVTPGGGCDAGLLGEAACDMLDQGHGIGYWLALLATFAGTALAAMRRTAD